MKKTYESGLWSERIDNKLTYGKKGKKSRSILFGADDKIEELSPYHIKCYGKALEKAGYTPDQFITVQPHQGLITKTLIPEIEACIAHSKKMEAERELQEKAVLEADIKTGKAFRSVEIAEQYGAELQWARRLDEETKVNFNPEYHDEIMLTYHGRIKVERDAVKMVIGNRKADGCFPGCQNNAWIISEEEWDAIIKISPQIAAARKKNADAAINAEIADLQKKSDNGYCFSCGSYCYGDCGNYNNSMAKATELLIKETTREDTTSYEG